MSESETTFGVGDTVKVIDPFAQRVGMKGTILRMTEDGWDINFAIDPYDHLPTTYEDGGLTLVSKAPQPESLPGGDDCTNKPIADPGFDELAPAAKEADDADTAVASLEGWACLLRAASVGLADKPGVKCEQLVVCHVADEIAAVVERLKGGCE